MTIAREHRTGKATPAPGPSGAEAEVPPILAEGVELIGEYEGSGYREAPSLVRRPDGQVIQLPPLLYEVAVRADGQRSYEQIAEEMTVAIERGVDADSVRFLAEEKLRPLGVLAAADGRSPVVEKHDPLLGFKLKAAVIPESVSHGLGGMFQPLFLPLIVLGVLGTLVVADWWLFTVHGVAQSVRQAVYHPGVFLPLFAAIVLSAGFHEIGHAAACRYGGGKPGKMGCGLYLAWPAFYTDVSDTYRLGRGARLRTDLGGIYFNAIVVIATTAAFLVTGFEPLLLLIVFQHLEIAHQLLPVVRLDGYYIVSDLTGVPDLFTRTGPILRSMVPWNKPDERVRQLKPWVRLAVTGWVLVVVPLLVFELLVILAHLPRILGTAWDSGQQVFSSLRDAFGSGDTLGGISAALQLVVLTLPILGILLIVARTGRGGVRFVWRRTEGRPMVRTVAILAAGAAVALLLNSWLSPRNYTPIQPGERGTLVQGIRGIQDLSDLPKESPPSSPAGSEATTTTTPTATPTTAADGPGTTVARPTTTVGATTSTTVARTTTTQAAPTTTTP
ncbi:MAG: hypothetical protein ACRD12_08340 [Acidimicrobiales bacterium]